MTIETEDEFITDVVRFFVDEIAKGNEAFAIISFKHDEERDTMRATHATIQALLTERAGIMGDEVAKIVAKFMNEHYPRWSQ